MSLTAKTYHLLYDYVRNKRRGKFLKRLKVYIHLFVESVFHSCHLA